MRNLFILAVTAAVGLPAFAGDCHSVLQSLPQSAGYSYSQSTFAQQAPVVYDVAPAPVCTCQSALSSLPSYSSLPLQTSAAAYAAPSYYLPSAGAVSYRSYAASIPQTYISRSFDVPVYHRSAAFSTGYLPQTRFLGPPVRDYAFRGQLRDVSFGGGGGGPISNIIRAIGDVANSPAGTFALGAFVGNGFRFGGPRTNTVVVPGGNITPAQAAAFNASQRRR